MHSIFTKLSAELYIFMQGLRQATAIQTYKTDQKKTHKILIIQSASCQPCKFMSKKGGVKFVYIFYSLTNFLYKKKQYNFLEVIRAESRRRFLCFIVLYWYMVFLSQPKG